MFRHNLPAHLVRAFTPSRLAAGVAVIVVLLSAACSDSSSRITSPAFNPSLNPGLIGRSNSQTAGAPSFAVLANAAVTCTDGTIAGDAGTSLGTPTGSVTLTGCPIRGTVHVGNGVAIQALGDFFDTYAALAPKPGGCMMLKSTFAGVLLPPGTYCFMPATVLRGVLTLKGPANGIWLFTIGASGTGALTATDFSMVMAGDGDVCNVTWWVSDAATMTDSHFIGTILAGAGITLTRGTFAGNAWSKADVTVTGTAVTGCEGSKGNGNDKAKCNQGVGNGPEGCDPGKSDKGNTSNDENGGGRGKPPRA